MSIDQPGMRYTNFDGGMTVRRKPIADRWEEIKPGFLRLYHEENRSLDEVRRQLEEKHDFGASRSAFTRQIEKWNAFKNYKDQTSNSWLRNESVDSIPKWIFKADLSSGIGCTVPPVVRGSRSGVKSLALLPLDMQIARAL